MEGDLYCGYTAWGTALDVDALLKKARPAGRHSVWRKGDDTYGAPAVTSGVSMVVFSGGSEKSFQRAVLRFLTRERRFLLAVRKMVGPGVRSDLGTTLHVRDGQVQPFGIELPPKALAVLGVTGVIWRVGVMPCFADGTYKLAGAVQQ